MKKKHLILALICILLSLTCGCTTKTPEFTPGENEGDSRFVWVCKEPFGFFYTTNDYEDFLEALNKHNEKLEKEGVPDTFFYTPTSLSDVLLKGYIEKEGKFVCFYSDFNPIGGSTDFWKKETWGDPSEYASFWGYADYYKNVFYLDIEDDPMNFFGGELPELQFDKMTKEDFLEKYGDIKNVSELLE